MKVPNFKDTQVFSHLDGIGYVNEVSIDKNIHFIINFQNGSTKSFLIPLAFNSGLLSTQDRQLAGYLSSLSQDGTIKEPAKANTDIPTSSELNLTITDKYALTKQRLAMLGALDDFYQLYVDVYDFIIQQMINPNLYLKIGIKTTLVKYFSTFRILSNHGFENYLSHS